VDSIAEVKKLFEEGDNFCKQGNWEVASQQYGKAFNYYVENVALDDSLRLKCGPVIPMWLLYNKMHADFQLEDFQEVMQSAALVHRLFGMLKGFVVGNPYFHLRVGQAKYQLCPSEQKNQQGMHSPIDDLARALICGGAKMFKDEPAEYYDFVTPILRPPNGFESWDTVPGCAIDTLNSCVGFLKEVFTTKFGFEAPWDV
jgi:hypothetical protein